VFERLGHFIVKRSKRVLILFTLGILLAGGVGSLAFGKLDSGGYSDLNSESAKAATYLSEKFKVEEPVAILVIDSGDKSVDDAAISQQALAVEKEVGQIAGISKTLSFWSTGGAPNLKSTDGKAAFLFAYANTEVGDFDSIGQIGKDIQAAFDGKRGDLTIYAAGAGVVTYAINHKIESDLLLAESIAIPLTFLLLIFVFIYLITLFTNVSIFALNLITGLGLGLGIDYALLMVNRFREELHSGKSVEDSVRTTINTAGKTVFYSGLTVLVTLSALLFFPLDFLKSFGYAGVSVVTLAVLGALIPLPAIMALLGHKIDKGAVRKGGITPKEDGRWAHTARNVMKRPVPVVIGSLLLLGVMAAPITNIAFARIQVIPGQSSRTIDAERLIKEIRALDKPAGTLIGGAAADFTDSQSGISRTLPLALGWIAFWVMILIFIFTGSIILPIKAVLLNALSLTATLGAVTWIFIDGNLKWLVGDFTVTGTLDSGTVILVAVVVFGLSMDYELFLLSRIREEHMAGKSNIESVATGLQRSARIITAAALLLAVVFAAFMTSGVTSIKMLGFGVSLAVLLDATLIRALLVPALMRLFGETNWWAPKPLRRFTMTH